MKNNIDWMNDVGAPGVVTILNVGTRASTMTMFGYPVSVWLPYTITAGGYLAYAMGWGGKYSGFLKNMAIAAAPLAFEKAYNTIKGTTVSRFAPRAVSHGVTRSYQPEFAGTGAKAF